MITPGKLGVVFAALVGGFHLVWAIFVAVGWAQPLLNFIFWAHMIQPIYVIKAFDPVAAVTLLLITSSLGYLAGFIAGLVWNRVARPA